MLSDQEWFRGVYETYFDRLQKHLYNRAGGNGLLAQQMEDCLQDVFITLWTHREQCRKHPNLGGWLMKTLRYNYLQRLERMKREQKLGGVSLDQPLDREADQSDSLLDELAEMAFEDWGPDALERVRAEVGEEDYALLLAYYRRQIPSDQLAAQMGTSLHGLRMRVSRTVKAMRSITFHFILTICLLPLMGFKG